MRNLRVYSKYLLLHFNSMMSISHIEIPTVFTHILVLYIFVGIGFGSAKSGLFPENASQVLSRFVIRISMPATILSKMISADFTGEDYRNGGKLFVIALAFLGLTLLLACLVTRLLGLSEITANVYKMQAMFGNVIFFAFPLFLALFGDRGILYALFFNMGNDALLWTVGIWLASRHRGGGIKESIRHLLNINTFAFAGGLILMATGVGAVLRDTFIDTVLSSIGATTSPLSMIFVGMVLAGIPLKTFVTGKNFLALSALTLQKLLLVPLLSIPILLAVKEFLGEETILIAVMQLSMPTATLAVSLTAEYDSDYRFAAAGVLSTTVFSILTMPLVVWVLKCFY